MSKANLPQQYEWLSRETGPKILVAALQLYGTVEAPGDIDNPTILAWARELGISEYTHDATAWCGLFMAKAVSDAGYQPVRIPLRALAWSAWGRPAPVPMLGDVLTFERKGGGHVGLYVAEDDVAYHTLGGNQSDKASIARIDKARLHAARRSPFAIAQPSNVRRVFVRPSGALSSNEA